MNGSTSSASSTKTGGAAAWIAPLAAGLPELGERSRRASRRRFGQHGSRQPARLVVDSQQVKAKRAECGGRVSCWKWERGLCRSRWVSESSCHGRPHQYEPGRAVHDRAWAVARLAA